MLVRPRTTIRSPTRSSASIAFPRALPSGQTCAFSSTLPCRAPGRIGHFRSQATCHLPADVSGGAPGTRWTRGGVTTTARRTTPGIETTLGAKVRRTVVGQAGRFRGVGVADAVGVGLGDGAVVGRSGGGCAGIAYAGVAPTGPEPRRPDDDAGGRGQHRGQRHCCDPVHLRSPPVSTATPHRPDRDATRAGGPAGSEPDLIITIGLPA